MNRGIGKLSIFLVILCYLLSRLLLLSPVAVEKKSKRLIFFQERYASITRVSKTVTSVSGDALVKIYKSTDRKVALALCHFLNNTKENSCILVISARNFFVARLMNLTMLPLSLSVFNCSFRLAVACIQAIIVYLHFT